MAEIKLNKPLYEEDAKPGAQAPPATEAPGRPPTLARVAALVIDLFVLYLAGQGLLRAAFDQLLPLGWLGPWLGLLAATVYLSVCGTGLTQGRTLGKAVMRMRVSDIAGPDLPAARAVKRAVLLMLPLAIYTAVTHYLETHENLESVSFTSVPRICTMALCAGWYLGNLIFCLLDPAGRTFCDHVAGSIVTSNEATPAAVLEFLRSARETHNPARARNAQLGLVLSIAAFQVLAGIMVWQESRYLAGITDEQRAEIVEVRKAFALDGFIGPFGQGMEPAGEAPATTGTATADTPTSAVVFQYRSRGPIDVETLKKNDRAMSMAAAITQWQVRLIDRSLERAEIRDKIPPTMYYRTAFAEHVDLFFVWQSREVYGVRHLADFRPVIAKHRGRQTTSTVAASAPATTATATATSAPVSAARETSAPRQAP